MRSPTECVKIEEKVWELSPGALQDRRLDESPRESVGKSRLSGISESQGKNVSKGKSDQLCQILLID